MKNNPWGISDQKAQEIIDSIIGIFITDPEGHFIYVNEKFCERLEYSKNELLKAHISILDSKISPLESYQKFLPETLSGKTWKGICCHKTKTGKIIWVDSVVTPLYDQNNKIEKIFVSGLNVTEQIKNAQELKENENKLMEISKFASIGEISGFIAHEIKTPLTVMKMAVSSMHASLEQESIDLDKLKKLNNKMDEVSDRITKIVMALGSYSRDESLDKIKPHRFKDILDDVLLITEDVAKTDSIKMTIVNETADGLLVNCHKTQISQVLMNLIKNACDAVRKSEKKEVIIKIKSNNQNLEVRVQDTGAKIPDAIVEKFFTPYFTTKKEGEGTGIGLTISLKIIEAHQGKLFFDKECPQTCFVIILPLKPAIRP